MRILTILLVLFCLVLTPATSLGQFLYRNGDLNGTVDAWTINFGFVVSDSFSVSGFGVASGFDIWVWELPGDKALTVDWSITSNEFGGTTYGSGTAAVTDSFISANQYGYNIDKLSASIPLVSLNAGRYWLNLENAVTQAGNPLYWDENSGPSLASENELGTIPSEAFDLTTCFCCGIHDGPDCGPPVPEPASLLLFGSGLCGLAGWLLRKRF